MINHVSVNVSDFQKAKEFYTAALAPLGYSIQMDYSQYKSCGFGDTEKPDLWIGEGKGTIHVALVAKDKAAVQAFYDAGLAAGGTDNGKPGVRADYAPDYYAAFIKDADGNNIEALYRGL